MRQNIFICLALAGITLAVFWPVSRLDFFAYDDPLYIQLNPMVQGGITADSVWWAFTSYHAGNWHPVTWLSHALDCQLFGRNPGAFHLVNLAFHTANSLLLFIVLRKMTRAVWRSALVAALFAWHPAHVQSVAWISERKDLLSGFFMLLTLWAYARYAQGRSRVESRGSSAGSGSLALDARRWTFDYYLVLLFFALGLMSKPMLVTLPAILLLLDFWPLNRMSDSNRSAPPDRVTQFSIFKDLLWEKIPFLALSLVSVMATFQAQGSSGFIIKAGDLPLPVRIANVPVFCTVYLEKLFWPENLAVFYPYRHIPFWEQAGSFLLLALLTVICLRRIHSQPAWLVGWLWFLIMLLPVIGLVQVGGQSIADRYTYLPSIGIFVIVAWGLGEIAAISSRWLTGLAIGTTALMLACLLDTQIQLKYWRNSITLFGHALDVTKENNSACHFGLGNALWHEGGDLDGAVTNFQAALQTGSAYPWVQNLDNMAAHFNLGCVLLLTDKPEEAEVQLRAALKLNPNNAFAHMCIGDALSDQGKAAEAEAEYAAAIQLMPNNPVMLQTIEDSKTLARLRETLKTEPAPEIHVEMAQILTAKDKSKDAAEHYLAALKLKPEAPDILNNLAWLLATCTDKKVRDGSRAVQYARRACELTQFEQTVCLGTLAAAYAEAGKFDDAIAAAQRACDLAEKNGETDLLQKNRELLVLYRDHRPYHGPTNPNQKEPATDNHF
jgi:cytochrome c-type biogenesis protein CcmH/NrfG